MRSDATEPVTGISRVWFLPMQDRVPETGFGRVQILHDRMALVEAGKVEPQSGQSFLRRVCLLEQFRRFSSFELPSSRGQAASGSKGNKAVTVLVESEDFCHLRAVSF